jgi:transcriptional regulator with XRE-family HTH domain
MSKQKRKSTLTEALRNAIQQSGLTQYRLAADTGVPAGSIMRFTRGDQSIRLDKADLLADHLGLYLVRDPDAKPPEPTPENLARPMLVRPKPRRKAK